MSKRFNSKCIKTKYKCETSHDIGQGIPLPGKSELHARHCLPKSPKTFPYLYPLPLDGPSIVWHILHCFGLQLMLWVTWHGSNHSATYMPHCCSVDPSFMDSCFAPFLPVPSLMFLLFLPSLSFPPRPESAVLARR